MMRHLNKAMLRWLKKGGHDYWVEYDGDYGELEILHLEPTKDGCPSGAIIRHETLQRLENLGFKLTYIHQLPAEQVVAEFIR